MRASPRCLCGSLTEHPCLSLSISVTKPSFSARPWIYLHHMQKSSGLFLVRFSHVARLPWPWLSVCPGPNSALALVFRAWRFSSASSIASIVRNMYLARAAGCGQREFISLSSFILTKVSVLILDLDLHSSTVESNGTNRPCSFVRCSISRIGSTRHCRARRKLLASGMHPQGPGPDLVQ